MLLKKLRLTNFGCFFGEWEFHFKEGFNLVLGPGGTGKTILVNAFKFAVLRQTELPIADLINSQHKEQCLGKGCRVFGGAEATVQYEGKEYLAKNEVSLNEKGEIAQSSLVPLKLAEILTPTRFECLHLTPRLDWETEVRTEEAISKRLTFAIAKRLLTNIRLGLRMAIIEDVLGFMTGKEREDLIVLIRKMNLDQVIFLTKYADQAVSLIDELKVIVLDAKED